ncbi:hypothetical protein DYB37_007148 [Aphanomyces astaci]|uniref:Uncharacterized protein n=1 Tax=Aphanomyces astaci TaxID=112090 RepID=A0A3R6ZGU2_APHAT|nr:hypothetical protein DYB35_008139 [Aphanomyces astaci]RHZ19150.1 hypothetical protein DYB37_007148 [Aphanomyces astaci]
MVGPPSYAKQVVVRNDSGHTIHVTGLFGSDGQVADGNELIRQTVAVGPHSSATLGEHEYNMGTWTAVAPVYSVQADHPESNHQAQFKPQVSGVVSAVHVVLASDDNAGRLSLTQSHTVE